MPLEDAFFCVPEPYKRPEDLESKPSLLELLNFLESSGKFCGFRPGLGRLEGGRVTAILLI